MSDDTAGLAPTSDATTKETEPEVVAGIASGDLHPDQNRCRSGPIAGADGVARCCIWRPGLPPVAPLPLLLRAQRLTALAIRRQAAASRPRDHLFGWFEATRTEV